ncbi:MAG TPA: hypothetical protein VFD19_03350 [Clostridia bacterium]|nr:hypothetical protein [Clostridia bacterium]
MKKKSAKKSARKVEVVQSRGRSSRIIAGNRRLNQDYPEIFTPSPFTEDSRRKRVKERRRRKLIGWPLKLAAAIAVIAVIATAIALLPQFYIVDVTVQGTRLIESGEIAALVDHAKGEHFIHGIGGTLLQYLTLRYGPVEDLILGQFPQVREVQAQFRFPSQIRVKVDEKIEIMAVRVTGGFALIDRERCVLRIVEDIDFDLPVLEGVRVQREVEQNQILEIDDPVQLDAAISIVAGLIRHDMSHSSTLKLMDEIRQMRQVSDGVFYLFVPLSQGGEIRVKLEDNRLLQDRLNLLSYLLCEGGLKDRPAGELDLIGDSVYFRPDTT